MQGNVVIPSCMMPCTVRLLHASTSCKSGMVDVSQHPLLCCKAYSAASRQRIVHPDNILHMEKGSTLFGGVAGSTSHPGELCKMLSSHKRFAPPHQHQRPEPLSCHLFAIAPGVASLHETAKVANPVKGHHVGVMPSVGLPLPSLPMQCVTQRQCHHHARVSQGTGTPCTCSAH